MTIPANTIAVIDYGMGNLHSVAKAMEHVAPQAQVTVTDDPDTIRRADRVILPGVGAIRDCIAEIRRLGFDKLVWELADSGKPLLGICIGMQALLRHSDENDGVACLNLFEGEVKFFGDNLQHQNERLKVPHMGWNRVRHVQSHPLWQSIDDGERFYFVHSYFVAANPADFVAGICEYGLPFAAAIAKDNIFAVQFHPEKSQHAGLQLLANFACWDGKQWKGRQGIIE